MMDHPAIVVIVVIALAVGLLWCVNALFNNYVDSWKEDE